MEVTIYDKASVVVSKGGKWSINLQRKELLLNGKYLIKNGISQVEEPIGSNFHLDFLFNIYQHSIPTANEPSRPYFKGLNYDDLSEDDKTFAVSRDIARFDLEYGVLASIINGELTIPDGYWFWQSPMHKNFIILRSWIEQ